MKEFADNNFKLNENGRKLSKWIENTVGKEEIARYKQFLLFPQCFQRTRKNQGLFGKGLIDTSSQLQNLLTRIFTSFLCVLSLSQKEWMGSKNK